MNKIINAQDIKEITLTGDQLTIEQVVAVCRYNAKVVAPKGVYDRIQENWNAIAQMLAEGQIMYGLNTGIGGFGNVKIGKDKAAELSIRMLKAHSAGYGEPVPVEIAKAAILLRVNVFAKGYSGVRPILFQTMLEMVNRNVVSVIYQKGSVGTSGDLAPLSQMGLLIIGEGQAYFKGKKYPGLIALRKAGLEPIKLAYREGLAIMNGTQLSGAYACFNIYDSERLIKTSEISGSMTIEVLNCVEKAYDKRYSAVKPYKGQNDSAANIRKLIAGSEILKQEKKNVQNAYSLRCTPQVSGAAKDALGYIRRTTEIEINSVADNPIFFTKEKLCLTGGNFHGAPLGYTQDLLGIIITDIGSLSERRTNNLLDPACSKDLPAFLVMTPGLDSGLMICQYTQAALVSENKILASPASVDSIPVSANQEDHVSMSTIASRKAFEIIRNTEAVIAVELLAACQAYEFRKPLKPSKGFAAVYKLVRSFSPTITQDRAFYIDIEKIVPIVRNFDVLKTAENVVGKIK